MNSPEKIFKEYFKNKKKFNFPKRVTVELTNKCNLSCKMCPRKFLKNEIGFMEFYLFKKIIDEVSLININTPLVPFFRGESLLHPNFLNMIKYAKDKGIKPIQLATNATLLSSNISEELIKMKLDFISFSLHLKNEKEDVIDNIKNFIKIKKDMKSKLPETQVSIVKTQKLKKYIPSFVKKWLNIVDRVRVYEEHSKDGLFGSLSKKYIKERKPCLKVLTDIVIYWNGNVGLCNHDWERVDFIGNVSKQSIADIWNSEKYHKIRKQVWENDISDLICSHCDHWQVYYVPQNIIGELYVSKGKKEDVEI